MPKFNPNPTNLEKARRAVNLTREKLSELSGVSINTLMSYEHLHRNVNRAPLEDALRIADAIGVSVRAIMNDPQPSEVPESVQKNISKKAVSGTAAARGSRAVKKSSGVSRKPTTKKADTASRSKK